MYCRQCGHELQEGAVYCTNCAAPVNESAGNNPGANTTVNNTAAPKEGKNRVIVGLMALFLGSLGIHNFYLGYTSRGLTQLLVSIIGGMFSCGIATIAMGIWAFIESIQIFTGKIATDADGVPLHD